MVYKRRLTSCTLLTSAGCEAYKKDWLIVLRKEFRLKASFITKTMEYKLLS